MRDIGILHALQAIEDFDQLLAHPAVGESGEGFAIGQLIAAMPRWRPSFLRTGNGAEIALLMERGGRLQVFEIKLSKAPRPSRGFLELSSQFEPEQATIIAPTDEPFEWRKGVWVANLSTVISGKMPRYALVQ